jgi:hypothetical protein
MSTIEENQLTSMEADFVWSFLKRNEVEWRKLLSLYFAMDAVTVKEFTDTILRKLEYQINEL